MVQCLIPDWSLVKAFKQGRVSQTEYEIEYRSGLQQRWSEVSAWLASLSPDEDVTLLCHEREGHFCHRRLVAELVGNCRRDIEVALH
ncbi:MAG: DUF488 family protein [Chloroflexota bacterium]